MGSSVLLWVLGALTVATGALLALMWHRRRGAHHHARDVPKPRSNTRELVDAYAIPVAYDGPPKRKEVDDEPGKICPACGSRYAYHLRVCSRDDSELATLN